MCYTKNMTGKIFLVATPIGNLGDFSFRGVEVLKSVDLIAAEDTRRTQVLLNHYGISKKLISVREHNEAKKAAQLINLAQAGQKVAYLTDAGTPLISDPGLILVKEAVRAKIPVEAIPGPAAFLPALVLSGLSAEKFLFRGFLPAKTSERIKALDDVEDETATLIFYEAPHRLLKTLADLFEILGDRGISVARELTKKFEEIKRGRISEIIRHFEKKQPRGEFVIIIEGNQAPKSLKKDEREIKKIVREFLKLNLDDKKIINFLKNVFQISRNVAYRLILNIKKDGSG